MKKKIEKKGKYQVITIGGQVNEALTKQINATAKGKKIIAVIGGNILVEG